MVQVRVELSAEEYARLVEAVARRYGRKRGVISNFIRSAIQKAVEEVLQEKA